MHWACTSLTSFPDPTKPIWEQDMWVLERLMEVEKTLMDEAEKAKRRKEKP